MLPAAGATVRNVPSQYPTIQAAINASVNGDTVLVAPGTYYQAIDFNGKQIEVKSAQGPDVTAIAGDYTAPVVTFDTNETSSSVLRGFTLVYGTYGVYTFNSSPKIIDNAVVYNDTGMMISGGAALIEGNYVAGNSYCYSVGIASRGNGTVIRGNLIEQNLAEGCSAVEYAGISVLSEDGGLIEDNLIAGNTRGITMSFSANVTIRNNIIVDNYYTGLDVSSTTGASIIQNLVANSGGAELTQTGSTGTAYTIVNNTFADAGPSTTDVMLSNYQGAVTLYNNVVEGTIWCINESPGPALSHNNAGGYFQCDTSYTGTNGNISAAPLFMDSASYDYRLAEASPSRNAGTNSAPGIPQFDIVGRPRFWETRVDQGAFEFYIVKSTSGVPPPSSPPGPRRRPREFGVTASVESVDELTVLSRTTAPAETRVAPAVHPPAAAPLVVRFTG